ncbi:MAG: hypothetical protein JWM35_585 [Verrucomicrobia bacterium]|nr:hypothetical protein [Verrucomicrobiota bacterium]
MPDEPAPRPIAAGVTFALFAVVLALHFGASITGWRHGILPGNTFRQAQTALTTYFIGQENNFSLAYPTPVLGKPWSIPMEFPLYEWTVVGLNRLSHASLVECARFVSLLCFYLTLPGIWVLLRELGVDRARRWLVLAFVPACPVYIFYSRAFLIEPMALMFSVWFAAALLAGLKRLHRGWLVAAAIFGIGAALVKVTTFMLFLAPVGVALAWQFWIARRGGAAEQPAAWRRLHLAARTLALPFFAAAAWVLYSDSVKTHNPAADMLRSGPQRTYNFGHFADRFSGEYWTRWLNLSSHAVVSPWVFGLALVTALFGPRRWRWSIVSGIALFALAPAVFPFLYAWHDYYYYANAAFLTVALGFSAVAVLDSRIPRWLGALVIAGALVLQGQLYWKNYRPEQLVVSEGDTGLTQALFDLTARDDVLVVAGQDWNSMLAWSARRRALMIRNGYEDNFPYLERAFDDLNGEFVAALILTGNTRANERLLALADQKLNIFPTPFLESGDSQVYANREVWREWSGRAPTFTYNAVHVLNRDESAPSVLSGSLEDLHGSAIFDGLHPLPTRYEVPFGLSMLSVPPRWVLNTHATTHLWFSPPPGKHRATIEFGILDAAWQRPDKTDGVEFVVTVLSADGKSQAVWKRLVNPVAVAADRGIQHADFSFDLPPGAQVELSTLPGPSGINSFDWAYGAGFEIR